METDADGSFRFREVLPGQYRVIASKSGFITAEYGQRVPGSSGIDLTVGAGQRITDLRVLMDVAAVISGRVTELGRPLIEASVVAIRAVYIGGRLDFVPVLSGSTNDLGEYRLFGLQPGQYYIAAIAGPQGTTPYAVPDKIDESEVAVGRVEPEPIPGRVAVIRENEAYVHIYYPRAVDPQLATAIEVGAGSDIGNIDIDAGPVPAWRVRGRVVGLPTKNGTVAQALVGMRPVSPIPMINDTQFLITPSQPNGDFEFRKMAQGSYILSAATGDGVLGFIPVELRGPLDDLIVSLRPGLTLSGQVIVEGPTGAYTSIVSALTVRFQPQPAVTGSYTVSVAGDGTFSRQVAQNSYRILVPPLLTAPTPLDAAAPAVPDTLRSAYVKSVRAGEHDLLRSELDLTRGPSPPVVITVGMDAGRLYGQLVDRQQQPVSGGRVVLIPENDLRYRIDHKHAVTDGSGQFELSGLPPGSYKLYGWDVIAIGSWQDPRLMRVFEGKGVDVQIMSGDQQQIRLMAIEAER